MALGHEFAPENRPLNASERQSVIDEAYHSRSAEQVSTLLGLFSGMKPMWAAHITSDMIVETDAGLDITLKPGQHQCQNGGHGGPNNQWGTDREPCQYCEETGTFEFPSPRSIPIRNEKAVAAISQWFELYDILPSTATCRRLVKSVGKRAGVPRLSPVVLRHSFGVLLAAKGFSRREIARVMGFADSSVENSGYVFLSYGRLCEGPNPYTCSATKSDGTPCQIGVKEGEYCRNHDQTIPQCSEETARGKPCSQPATESDGRCHWHTTE